MELIFLLVAAVVRVSEEENVDSGHVPSHHHQSRPFPSFPCPGGRATRQTAEPANGNAPHHGCRALFMDGAGHGDVELSAFWFSGSLNPLSARSLNFLRAAHRSPNGEKNCILNSLLCIFIIIIIIITIIITIISFVALLNCLSTHQLPLSPTLLPTPPGGKGRVSERLSSAGSNNDALRRYHRRRRAWPWPVRGHLGSSWKTLLGDSRSFQ